jgi:transcriptional regulator with XRE-family HTH domain
MNTTQTTFGDYVRTRREQLRERDPAYSVRKVAGRIGVNPSYLSMVERGKFAPPSEATIRAWAVELDENPDVLLALAGKVSGDLREAIVKRPVLFAQLIRELKKLPDKAVLRIVREVRDGEW